MNSDIREQYESLIRQEIIQLRLWAIASRAGGWSTHQVEPMNKRADDLSVALVQIGMPADKVVRDPQVERIAELEAKVGKLRGENERSHALLDEIFQHPIDKNEPLDRKVDRFLADAVTVLREREILARGFEAMCGVGDYAISCMPANKVTEVKLARALIEKGR